MKFSKRILGSFIAIVIYGSATFGQQPQQPSTDDVLRVNAELVQTGVTVVDKDGRFVEGLARDQFQLSVDGKPRQISFFERVTAGSAREANLNAQLNAPPQASAEAFPIVVGRTIIFFIDDMHLSPDSLNRTRQMLREFLDHQMSTGDSVAIVSASGQIGFLGQFSNNKQVLEAAMARLNPRQYDVQGFGTGSTKMTEYLALNIETQKSDKRVMGFYVAECMKQNMPPKSSPAYSTLVAALRATCETDVKSSARAVLMQAAHITQNMYASLDSLMRSSARKPGRKLTFFVSDGFLMEAGPTAAGLRDKLDRIIDAATRAGVVVYTIDARGLGANMLVDAANSRPMAGTGDPAIATAQIGEIAATQDAMHALATDTGGRALRNMNYFDGWVNKMLDETSNYYLVAWRPDSETEKTPKLRNVQISIINRPDLSVRAPRGYIQGPTAADIATQPAPAANHPARTPETEMRDTLADYYPSRGLPTFLSLAYLNTPKNEMLLTSSMQVATSALDYGGDNKQPATVRLAGVILNDKGKVVGSFKSQLNVNPMTGQSDAAGVIYNERTPLPPGIYQVRAAARDERSRRIGSAIEWIVIPDLSSHQLSTSSILLGAQLVRKQDGQVQFSVDHRFPRASRLGHWIFIYNSKRNDNGAPSLTVRSQVLRENRVVLNPPAHRITTGGDDPDRILFSDGPPLDTLPPGKYDLVITVKDEIAGTSTTQRIDFEIQ